MVNMLQISSSKNPGGEKLDDIAYIFVDIASSKTLYEKPQKGKTHIKKRVQCIMSQYHPPKTPSGKMDDMT